MQPSQQKEKDGAPTQPHKSGKEKASTEDSIASRILSSTTGLAKDLISSSTPFEASNSLATSTTNAKTSNGSSSSAASSSRWAEALPARPNGAAASSSQDHNHPTLLAEGSFRSHPGYSSTSVEFESFNEEYGSALGNGKQKQSDPSSWTTEFGSQSSNSFYPAHDSSVLVDYDDGAEVRALLAQPGSLDELDDPVMMTEDLSADAVADLFKAPSSEGEKQAADRIRGSLPEPPVHKALGADNPLALRPDFLGGDSHHPPNVEELTRSLELVTGSKDLTAAQKEGLLNTWDEALNSYTDVVWGDLLPAVQAAKTQLEEVRSRHAGLDDKAVTRLRMILGHINGVDSQLGQASNEMSTSHYHYGQANGFMQRDAFSASSFATAFMQEGGFQGVSFQAQYIDSDSSVQELRPTKQSLTGQVQQNSTQQRHNLDRRQEDRRKQHQPNDEDRSNLPTFHCPWISCHKSFKDMTALQLHSGSHSQLPCPHAGCDASFTDSQDWIAHWQESHHGLLDTRIRDIIDDDPMQIDERAARTIEVA